MSQILTLGHFSLHHFRHMNAHFVHPVAIRITQSAVVGLQLLSIDEKNDRNIVRHPSRIMNLYFRRVHSVLSRF